MDFVKKARENPALVTGGAILAALGLLATAWTFFNINKSLFEVAVDVVTLALNTGAVVAALIALGLLASIGALVAVVIGSVRNRDEAKRLAAENAQLQRQCSGLTTERDSARAAAVATRRQFGRERLFFLSQTSSEGNRPTVTIRFIGHGPDHAIVEQIENILQEVNQSWPITRDGKNDPILLPKAGLKVEFEMTRSLGFNLSALVMQAFQAGDWLEVPIGGVQTERTDHFHVVIRVLPSVS